MNKSALRSSRLLLAAGLALAFSAAQAAPITFDFGAVGAVPGNEQGNPNEVDGTPVGLRFDNSNVVYTNDFSGPGLQVIATGQNQSGTDNPYAYLDGTDGGLEAGLGVCQTLSGTQCAPNSDDNVTGTPNFDEQLTLTFNSLVELSGLTFKGEHHKPVGSSELHATETFLLDGNTTTFGDAEAGSFSMIGTEFTFGYGGDNPEQFYLGAVSAEVQDQDVPAPAAIGLLGFGLVGLGAAIRRRRRIG